MVILAPAAMQATDTTLQSKQQELHTAQAELHEARQELQERERQLRNLMADLHGGDPCTEQTCKSAAGRVCRYSEHACSVWSLHAGRTARSKEVTLALQPAI